MSQKYERFDDEVIEDKKSSSGMGLNGTTAAISNRTNNNNSSTSSESTIEVTPEEEVVFDDKLLINRREKVRRIVENVYFRLIGVILIIIDLILLIIDLSIDKSESEKLVFDLLSMMFGTYFVVEVSLRIYAKKMEVFFSDMLDTLDFVVIFVSYIVTTIYCFIELSGFTRLILFGRVVRIVRSVILIRLIYTEPRNVRKGVRHAVSENKRRFRTSLFDLDLTYITDQMIAMSFPSSGKMAIYRNNIKDVSNFLNKSHGKDFYKVYNLCSERHYDTSYFHGRAVRYPIDDHNVPSLQQIADFCLDVSQWLKKDPKNVIAVHCLGGKGRTGTMVCSYLVYSNKFQTSIEALHYFAERRTDKSVSEKFQGVETPSQSRYVQYFTEITTQMAGKLPKIQKLRLKTIRIYSLLGIGVGNGSDFTCNISINRETLFNLDFGLDTNCRTDYNSVGDFLTVEPINCPILLGDVRLKFNCKTKSVIRAYEDCAFYFWFNTSFIKDNTLRLDRTQIDNPHKPKTWKLYREYFSIELDFDSINDMTNNL